METSISHMSAEALLLARVLYGHRFSDRIDRELDRRALAGPPERQSPDVRAPEEARLVA